MAKKQLVICPKAGKCKSDGCFHKTPHERCGVCSGGECDRRGRPEGQIGQCEALTKPKPAKQKLSLEQLIKWAKKNLWIAEFYPSGVDIKSNNGQGGGRLLSTGKTLLSALRAARKKWEEK